MKTICWGLPNVIVGPNWVRTGLVFHTPENLHAFGLKASKGAAKAFQLVLEAYILKKLLFEKASKKATQ